MQKIYFFTALFFTICFQCFSQDSVWVKLRPKYNRVNGLHRAFFGENYRKEWSDSTLLPVIDLAQTDGGLKPVRLGGGHQTVSLRLVSPTGNEWVIRNIEKDASVLLPEGLRQTFARDVVDDAMSAQHPFSPLVVSELAQAANIPHAHPVIGVIRGGDVLGEYSKQFEGKVCLLEEREPMGDSENSLRMFQDLNNDNDNSIDGEAFLRARLLDLLIGDWDRHPDQWRWVDVKKGKSKLYVGIPRDRDQAFYLNEGVFPRLARQPWIVPSLQGFSGKIKRPKYSLREGGFMHSRPAMFFSLEEWMRITNDFTSRLSDSVLQRALLRLPPVAWERRHTELFDQLKERRDNIPQAMKEYYHFIYRVPEIQLSNKNELVTITDGTNGSLLLNVDKLGKNSGRETILSTEFTPDITKELRIYTKNGADSVYINQHSPIRIRVVGDEGDKKYFVSHSSRKVKIYGKPDNVTYYGEKQKMDLRLSDDSANTAYVATNRYNIFKPLVGAGFNKDDGFILGLGFQFTKQGFRKLPYGSLNRLIVYHSFATSAFKIRYYSEWIKLLKNTDLVLSADIFAPENTHNFFGTGNETFFNKTGDHITFYRSRFSLYQVAAGLRWKYGKGVSLSVGPAFQHYAYDSADNVGRFLGNGSLVKTYDSLTISKNKTHAGLFVNLTVNKRNNQIIPSKGYFLNIRFQALAGMSNSAKSYAQLIPEFSVYKSLSGKNTVVLSERIGGGVSMGKTAFYQSMFIGGHENLLGFRQYRFAGEHSVYNNLETRIRLTNFTGYIVPGEFGMLAFYDIGRVWVRDEDSKTWHQGAGGGLYFAPAKMAVVSLVAGYSKEGWYPYFTLGFRF